MQEKWINFLANSNLHLMFSLEWGSDWRTRNKNLTRRIRVREIGIPVARENGVMWQFFKSRGEISQEARMNSFKTVNNVRTMFKNWEHCVKRKYEKNICVVVELVENWSYSAAFSSYFFAVKTVEMLSSSIDRLIDSLAEWFFSY